MSLSGMEDAGGRRRPHSWRSRSKKWMPEATLKTERSFVNGLALLRTAAHSSARPCVVVRGLCATANGLASLCEAFAQRHTASCRCTKPLRNARLSARDSPPDWALRGQPSPVVWERVGHGEMPRSPRLKYYLNT